MSAAFDRLVAVVAQLRAPGGCPWDREQTHESLLPQLIEEAYEMIAAVRAGDNANLCEELGDLLLHIVLHAQIAGEHERFGIDQVIESVTDKMIRRHPHVFAESDARDTAAVLKQWDAIKHAEKENPNAHFLDRAAVGLPALMRAQKIQSKVARVGFDWSELPDVVAKVDEELGETKSAMESGDDDRAAEEIGDLLFAVVNLARKTKHDAELVLQAATDKFVHRFNRLEDELRAQGKKLGEVDLAAMDEIWDAVKQRAAAGHPERSEGLARDVRSSMAK